MSIRALVRRGRAPNLASHLTPSLAVPMHDSRLEPTAMRTSLALAQVTARVEADDPVREALGEAGGA